MVSHLALYFLQAEPFSLQYSRGGICIQVKGSHFPVSMRPNSILSWTVNLIKLYFEYLPVENFNTLGRAHEIQLFRFLHYT